jgi:putative membrane-bound dehydrogenase-like protein
MDVLSRPLRHALIAAPLLLGLSALKAAAEEPLPHVERLKTSPVLRHLKPNPLAAAPRSGPEKALSTMYVEEGFRAELIASEPELQQPIAFAFDERGRIWVLEAHCYPQKQPPGQGKDRILIFQDADGDGAFESRRVFAEGLNLASGLEVGFGGAWVGAAPELLFIPDADRDDVPDGPPQVLLDGFGYQDTHECLNSFLWGPDGWLYGNQGVFNFARIGKPGASDAERTELRAGVWRYHPLRRDFEVFASGGSNQWGLDYDERGQLWMTHCRSYWGRGPTTHVIQGGHYWNQANANHAPFIIGSPPAEYAAWRNYLLASARYDHGAGGAGAPGSDAIYGGHSHVGTMIYLGDNWPEEFRGRLFTHNLHGHQINQQINRPLGSGFDTVHAGRDVFFSSDPTYVAVDLQYGPDGAVYIIDWQDRQHCHNPNTERWDRSNGRIYRLQHQASFRPAKVDLAMIDDAGLVKLQRHRNEWFVRTARRLLAERARQRALDPKAMAGLEAMLRGDGDAILRLRALWSLHAAGALSDEGLRCALADEDEFVRGWAVQLACEEAARAARFEGELLRLAASEPSPVARRCLASSVPRLPATAAWSILEALSRRGEDRDDRHLPYLIWQGLAPRMAADLDRAFALAESASLPQLAEWTTWYAAVLGGPGLDRAVATLGGLEDHALRRRLDAIALAMDARANAPMPAAWRAAAPRLYAAGDAKVVRQAERLAAAFGDDSMFPQLRSTLADAGAELETRRHAFAVLSRAQDRAALPIFLGLLDDRGFRRPAINLLSRFDAPEIAAALLDRFERFSDDDRAAALNALCGRAAFSLALLDAVKAGSLKRDQLTAYHIRRLQQLKSPEVDQRLAAVWGKVSQSPAEKQARVAKLEKLFSEAPLWAFDGQAGKRHYEKLCASCHRLKGAGALIGPDLTGAGRNGIRYYLENLIDPNAVIGADFQMSTLITRQGEVISGLVIRETASAVTLRTTTEEVVVAVADILRRDRSESSLMPEGQLDSLNEREQIELLKFLIQN